MVIISAGMEASTTHPTPLGPGDQPASATGSMVLLTQLARVVYRASTEEVLGMRLKPYMALRLLRDNVSCAQQALGESLKMDANNLVLLLNELEAAGHVTRVRDPIDRRRHIVELTSAGKEALERAEVGMNSVEDEVLRNLGSEERAALGALLRRAIEGTGPDTSVVC